MTVQATEMMSKAFRSLLNGNGPNGVDPSSMGAYRELYEEMVRAYSDGGADATRGVFAAYVAKDSVLAALVAGDPEPRKVQWSAAELLAAQFPEPKWIVPGLITTGLTILAGRPKLGKSWLALQMAVGVGAGGQVLGRAVEQGKVLYLALEDNERRIQDRLRKQHASIHAQLDFHFEWSYLTEGGAADLITAVDQHGYNLVIVDTISRALGKTDQMDQADMNVALGSLQRLAISREIALLLVDHHRKSASDVGDVIDDVMGATSKASVADAALGLYRKRGEKTATLRVTGRDIDDQELALEWDHDVFCWQMVGDASGVKTDTVQADIINAIREHGGKATAAQIAKFLGKQPNNISRELQELVAKNVVIRCEKVGRAVPYQMVEND